MSRLVKIIDGVLHVAHTAVYAPGYTLLASDNVSAEGWTHYTDDVEVDDFVMPWQQPSGSEDAYSMGDTASHNGAVWRSLTPANVWEPGVSGWLDVSSAIPAWVQPTGAHDAYGADTLVQHSGQVWKSLLGANTGQPSISGWRAAVLLPPSGVPVYPAWSQPAGGHDAYALGDQVTHNAQVWTSTVAANVWEPGVYGWAAS